MVAQHFASVQLLKCPCRTGALRHRVIVALCSSHCSCPSPSAGWWFCAAVDGTYHSSDSDGCDDGSGCRRPLTNGREYFWAACGSKASCASSSERCARKRSLYLEVTKKGGRGWVIVMCKRILEVDESKCCRATAIQREHMAELNEPRLTRRSKNKFSARSFFFSSIAQSAIARYSHLACARTAWPNFSAM